VVKVISLKRYEKESLVKNFLVFFSLLEILLILLFMELYHTQKREYKQNLFKTMHVCNYTMKCPQFTYDFAPKDKSKLNELFDDHGLHSFFRIPKSEKFYIKLSYPEERYQSDIHHISQLLQIKFLLATFLLFAIALFFTFYSLRPIRKALRVNDEFIKDILHDFNTPITSIVLNMKMFKEERGEDPYLQRISHGVDSILLLQNNLKSFLHHSPSENEHLDIALLAQKRLHFIQNIYPKLHFVYEKNNNLIKYTNEELLTRILDNLLSNAAKYNKKKGEVKLIITNDTISIQDTGKGIQDVQKVLDRYYKEQDRGLGLGLHIVQKLTNELNIAIEIKSQLGKGTEIILDFTDIKEENL
jgi:signal transduction histidine kinase